VIKSEYANIKDEDKLQALIRERRRQNEELSKPIFFLCFLNKPISPWH